MPALVAAVAAALASPTLGTSGHVPASRLQPAALAAAPPDALRPAASQLVVRAETAVTWAEGETTVLQLEANVRLEADEAVLEADRAVLWLTKVPGEPRTRVDVVLFAGDDPDAPPALLATPEVRRSGPQLAVDLVVAGIFGSDAAAGVRLDVPESGRVARDASDGDLYRQAAALRRETGPIDPPADVDVPEPEPLPAVPTPTPAGPPPVTLFAGELRTEAGEDGNVVVVAVGGVFVMRRTGAGDVLELQADRAVIFTTLDRLTDVVTGDPRRLGEIVSGVYLEGDVRAVYTPAPGRDRGTSVGREQRLEASRAFYDFQTDRAMLSDAVVHTSVPGLNLPLTLRARTVRQVAQGEYEAVRGEVSTSRLATPEYSLRASRVFVRTRPTPDGVGRTVVGGRHVTPRAFGMPFFYLPVVRFSDDGRFPLRNVRVGEDRTFGPSIETRWGLFETIGVTAPDQVDATYSLDYYNFRGFGAGADLRYDGDRTLGSAEPFNFTGRLDGYLVDDAGEDRLGGRRVRFQQDGTRGRALWTHQQFLPDGWAVHARAGFVSDATYMEQWERDLFLHGPPHDTSIVLDRSRGNEWLAFTVAAHPTDFFTTAEFAQENLYVERLPELQYVRAGDRAGPFTVSTRHRAGALRFDTHGADFLADYGFSDSPGTPGFDEGFTGIPTVGYTGTTGNVVGRLDLRQEVASPIDAGLLRVTPFAVGRFTLWSDTPADLSRGRVLGGIGLRVATAFARVDDRVYSRLLDLDRLRHLVEPRLEAFAGASTRSRDEAFIFDEEVDGADAVSALRLTLGQRFQTYRGPPGRRRTSDVAVWNVDALLFGDGPDDVEVQTNAPLAPPASAGDFRGRYFADVPEASLARDTLSTDVLLRVSDTTAFVADAAWSLEADELATVAGGVIVTRDDRLRYNVGGRVVPTLDLRIGTLAGEYRLSQRYQVSATSAWDFDQNNIRNLNVQINRRFEKAVLNVGVFYNRINDDFGFRFSIYPADLPRLRLTSDQVFRD